MQPSRTERHSVSARCRATLMRLIRAPSTTAGGWLPFDRFMALALYAPGLGYYARDSRQFGAMPASGSDFVTAPELSPLFGRALARAGARRRSTPAARDEVWEFGAGSGALAAQLLDALGERVRALHDRRPVGQRCASASASGWRAFGDAGALARRAARRDARRGRRQRGARRDAGATAALRRRAAGSSAASCVAGDGASPGADRPTALRPPVRRRHFVPGTTTEIHPQAEAFVAHAGRAPGARRGVLHRLRLPRGRVLPPAAHRRHADVPPRAPRRRRPAGRRRRQGHHRARQLHRHRAGRAGRRLRGAGLHLAGALPAELRPRRRCCERAALRGRATARRS